MGIGNEILYIGVNVLCTGIVIMWSESKRARQKRDFRAKQHATQCQWIETRKLPRWTKALCELGGLRNSVHDLIWNVLGDISQT